MKSNKVKNTKTKAKTKTKTKKLKFKIYISYSKRLIIMLILFVISFAFCLLLAFKSLEYQTPSLVQYTENQNIDYKVYLKPNNFYEEKYLEQDMLYIASLIDYIDIDFNYNFNIQEKTSLDFDYQIIGNLSIKNESGSLKYFEKEYILLDHKNVGIIDENMKSIDEKIKIDYQYYNDLANNFKTQYGIDTSSYLNIYLKVKKNSDDDANINLNDETSSSITIPLSEKAISIQFDAKDVNSVKNALTNKKIIFHGKIFVIEMIFFILSSVFLFKIIKLICLISKKDLSYDKMLKRILKEYDRLIVETTTPYDVESSHIIEIKKFEELLDVRDNLKLPIMYYNITHHQKCYFYIKNHDDVYLFKLKAVDLEKKDEKAK